MTVATQEAPAAEIDIPQAGKVLVLAEDRPWRLNDFVRSFKAQHPYIPVRIVDYSRPEMKRDWPDESFKAFQVDRDVKVIPVDTYRKGTRALECALENEESILVLDYELLDDAKEYTLQYLEAMYSSASNRIYSYSTVPVYKPLVRTYADPSNVLTPVTEKIQGSTVIKSFLLEKEPERGAVDFFGTQNDS